LLEDTLILEDRRGQLPKLHISLGNALGRVHHVMLPFQLEIGLLENLQRRIIERLTLRDNLEHLDGLRQLGNLARSKCNRHAWAVMPQAHAFVERQNDAPPLTRLPGKLAPANPG
jgi:hypothetical protein